MHRRTIYGKRDPREDQERIEVVSKHTCHLSHDYDVVLRAGGGSGLKSNMRGKEK